MSILAVGRALPPHYVPQEQLIAALRSAWAARHHNLDRLEKLHRSVLVGGRHLALPLEDYAVLDTFGKANDAFIRVGTDLGADAVSAALSLAGLGPKDIDAIYFTSVTGIAAPSLDARLCNRLGLRGDIKRVPIFGLGCVAGAAGIARCADYVRGFPGHVAVLLSVELCSLTLQREDLSIPNLIASGLFGDGAACAVVVGDDHPLAPRGPRVVATRSAFYPDTESVMGWSIGERGFRIVLSAQVPDMVRLHLGDDVRGFLAAHGLALSDVHTWIAHPGGPRVLEEMEAVLALPREALRHTWESLRAVGNMSSASVLHVLADTLADTPPPAGAFGVMLAMGPGFCSELVLLQW